MSLPPYHPQPNEALDELGRLGKELSQDAQQARDQKITELRQQKAAIEKELGKLRGELEEQAESLEDELSSIEQKAAKKDAALVDELVQEIKKQGGDTALADELGKLAKTNPLTPDLKKRKQDVEKLLKEARSKALRQLAEKQKEARDKIAKERDEAVKPVKEKLARAQAALKPALSATDQIQKQIDSLEKLPANLKKKSDLLTVTKACKADESIPHGGPCTLCGEEEGSPVHRIPRPPAAIAEVKKLYDNLAALTQPFLEIAQEAAKEEASLEEAEEASIEELKQQMAECLEQLKSRGKELEDETEEVFEKPAYRDPEKELAEKLEKKLGSKKAVEDLKTKAAEMGMTLTGLSELAAGKMLGTLICVDPEGKVKVLKAFSGKINADKKVWGNSAPVKDLKSFDPDNPVEKFSDNDRVDNVPGNCAAQKLLRMAADADPKLIPLGMAEMWIGLPNEGFPPKEPGHLYDSCYTCKNTLGRVMCGLDELQKANSEVVSKAKSDLGIP